MKKSASIFLILFSISFLLYLALPSPGFPVPPPDALRSQEPGDTETPLRRAYFTNLTREEVMDYYKDQFKHPLILGLSLPTYRLNYPPEEAQTIIRDQTRSTFLEEIVHPFRESVFVNGFEPINEKDAIFIEGKMWRQKIIVRHVPSDVWVRVVIGSATLLLLAFLLNEWLASVKDIKRYFKRA